jgi:CRP-like cAMP-binding protein
VEQDVDTVRNEAQFLLRGSGMMTVNRFGLVGARHGASGGATLSWVDNRLLAALLAAEDAAALLERPTYLSRGEWLWEAGTPLTHVFFPVRGVVSLGYAGEGGDTAHLAFVGCEGVVGVESFLGAEKTSYRALVQFPGAAYRLKVSTLRRRLIHGKKAPDALLKYALALMLEISRSSLCNLRHSVEQRLCRSLLQGVDRAASSTLPMTQDEVAGLVGARRQGVSEAAQKLRDLGLIANGRGSITVLDRARLAARACECYGVVGAATDGMPRVAAPGRPFAG